MPTMYMPVTNDELELPLAPPMPSRAQVARWGGISPNNGNWQTAGTEKGFRIVGVVL